MLSPNGLEVLIALENEQGQNTKKGTSHYGVTKIAFKQYVIDHEKDKNNKIAKMSFDSLKNNAKAASEVRDYYIQYVEQVLNKKGGLDSYKQNERDGIIIEAYNNGPFAIPMTRKAIDNHAPIEDVIDAMIKDEPNSSDDLSKYPPEKKGKLNRLYTEIRMMFNPDYSEINTRKKLDEKFKEWETRKTTDYIREQINNIRNGKKIFNEQQEQIYNADSIINNTLNNPNTQQSQQPNIQPSQQQQKPDKKSFIRNFANILSGGLLDMVEMFGGNKNDLQSTDKYAITNSAGENNDGNTNNNMQ